MEKVFYPMRAPTRTRPESKPMRVLCLGLSRNGTNSLREALQILGYDSVYHGLTITAKQRSDCAFWVPLMEKKFKSEASRTQALSNIDFDSVLGPCEAVTDGPANIFGEELVKYYPEAKVFGALMWTLSWFDTGLWWLWRNFFLVMIGYYHGDFERNGRQGAKEHYERLEEMLKREEKKWLDWSVKDGWEPLCAFLNKPVPDVPFPDGSKGGDESEESTEDAMTDLVQNAIKNIGIVLAGLTVTCASAALGLVIWKPGA